VRRRNGVPWARDGDDVVLLDVEAARYLTLNATGGWLWEELDRPRAVADLVRSLVTGHDVTEAEAATAVEAFLDVLLDRNLLLRVAEPGDAQPSRPSAEG